MIQNRNGYVPGEKVITTDRLVPIKQDIKKLDERVSELEHCCEELDEELVTEKIIVDELQVNGNTYLGNIESSGVHCACSFVGNNASISDITTENITVNNCATIKDAHIEKAVIDNLTFEEETVDDITINCHLQVDGSSCFTNTINGNITNADTATNIATNPIIHSCDGLTYDEWGTKFCIQVGDKCSNEINVNQATSAYTSETSNNAENANKFDFCSADDWRDYIASQIPTCAADSAKFAGKDCDEWKTIIKETCVDNAVSADTATNLASNPQLSLGSIDCCAITVTAGNMTSQEFTVPYASEASTAGLANNSTCFNGKTYAETCADILSGCAAKADEATCLKDAPVLSCNGSCIYVTAGNKNSNCITVPYSKCSAATLISASGADSTFPIVMDSTAGNASGYHSFIKDCGNNLTYNPSKDLLQSPNITATNCLKGDLVCAKTCITTPKIEATCVITCGVCNNGDSNINGDVNIGGDLYVTGTAHYTHSEEVITQSENIILRDEATTPVPSGHYSGFVVTNYDGNGNDLEVGADSAGTLKIGTCASNMEAVATRDDSDNMEDSYATKWCASCKKIVTSGITCTHDLCVNGDACATGNVIANAFCGSLVGNADTATDTTCFGGCTYAEACADILSGNAASASKLSTSCCINGTAFDGSTSITTAKWGTARNVQISDCDGTNISGTVSVDGSANVCLKLPSTIKATLTGKADSAKAVTTCPTTVNATCYITLSANNTAGDKQIYTNTNLKYNPSTGALSATTFCGSFTGTSDNATCFDGKTYSCACADIRSGLTSCVGTVTGVTVNGVAGTGTGAITVSNVPACGGCADTADCSKTVCVVAENTDSAYAVPLVKDWNCTTIANVTLKGSSNRQLTFNPSQGVLDSRFVHVTCNVKTPAVTSAPTYCTATDIVFCTHKADNTWLDTVKMSSNGLLCGRLYGVGSTSNYNFKIPFSSATGGLTSGTVSNIVHLNHVDSQDTFTYNPSTNTLRVFNLVSDTGRFNNHAVVPTIYSKASDCISAGGNADLTFISRCKNSSGTLSDFCSCICGSNGIYYNGYGINLNGYTQKHGKVIDLSAQSCCNFYPVTYQAANPYDADIEITSPTFSGICPFNQNYIHYLHRSGGWGDTPKTFAVLTNKRYDNAEITIGAIGQGTTDSYYGVVWLRGGMKYNTNANVDLTVHTSNWTHGQSTFTVGTTYCGSGTNANVSYSLASPINETTRFESMVVSRITNVGTVSSPQTNNTLTGTEFYGHRADNTNKLVACANGNGFYRALYGECGNANYKIPFTTLSGCTAAGTTALTLDRVTTADTFTYNAMCNVLRVGTVCGALKSGNYVACSPTTPGQAGTYVASGAVEMLAATPHVDFHHNNAQADYSARLINNAVGRAELMVNNATGCCASTCSSTFQFCYDGILTAPYFSSDRTVKGEFGHSNEFNLTSCSGTYMWLNYRGGSKEIKVGNGNGAGGLGVVCAACFCGALCGTVACATNAVNATNATNANFATNAGNASNASNAGFATNAGSLCDYAFTACCDRNVVITEGPSGGYAHHGTSTACPLTFNPATGVLTAKCFCGCVTATGTIDNATCFAGCTYASAKTDIRSGLTSCTGTVTISNSNANSSIPVALCTGSTSVGKSTGNALCYNPFTGALCARQFNSTTAGIAIGNACGDASASGNYSIAIGNSASSGPNMSIAIGKNARTFSCGSAVVCSVVGCTATIYIPEGTKRCDAYKLLFADTNNMMLFNGMYWAAIGQSGYTDALGQYSSVTRLSYSNNAQAFYVNGFPVWNGATNVELTIDTFQATDITTTTKFILFTYTRVG